jgi:hypothetical protein
VTLNSSSDRKLCTELQKIGVKFDAENIDEFLSKAPDEYF